MPNLLKDLQIDEVSSVDRGAGEGVKIMLIKRADDEPEPYWKRDFSDDQRDRLAGTGAALPDGSFPIETVGDLENAVRAFGRAKDKAKAKAHIISRARSLGALDKLPQDWGVSKGADEMADGTEEERKAREDKEKAEREKASKANSKKKPPKEEGDSENDGDNEDEDEAEKRTCKAIAAGADAMAKMSPKHADYFHNSDWSDQDKTKFLRMSPKQRDQHIADNPDPQDAMPPAVKKRLEQAAADRAELQKLVEERDARTFEKRATDIGLPASAGDMLRKVYKGDATAIAKLEQTIKALTSQVEASKLFSEFGAAGGGPASVEAEVAQKVAELRKATPRLSEAQAFTKVYTDPVNADLKKRYDDEQARGRRVA